MFQNAWSTKSGTTTLSPVEVKHPGNFVNIESLEYVRTLYWDEHCLECSAPACYSTCPLYIRRPDGACRRFDYGIKVLERLPDTLWRVRLKFRKWSKIEARINNGTLPVTQLLELDAVDKIKANIFRCMSRVAGYRFSRRFDGLRRRKYARINASTRFADDFLFQCRYEGDESFTMLLEITDRNNVVIYKTGMDITNGYNQHIIKPEFTLPESGLVRLYPEDNKTVELEIYAADFVQTKNKIPQQPSGKIKCVAWDLDNTVWNGILAESNPDTLELCKDIRQAFSELDNRGIIQVVVSKNDTEAVMPVLQRLGISHFFVHVFANWNPKSENIYNASRVLNIGVDTFALIDDSEFERTEVAETLSCVRTYDEKGILSLFDCPEFDVPVTPDGSKRRLSYQQEASRKQVRNNFGGQNVEFIRNCRIEMTIAPLTTEEQRKRSIELLLRTNQLNLSARRYSEEEFGKLLLEEGAESLALWVKDRFGDYGQVAFIHFKVADNIIITEYAMSCRVAAKLIENALFAWLQSKYKKNIEAIGIKTERNTTLVEALAKVGFTSNQCAPGHIHLLLTGDKQIRDTDCIKLIINNA